MRKFHVKKGNEVVVIAGTERGKRGKVIHILRNKERVIVEGVKMIKKHTRKNQQNPQGAIVKDLCTYQMLCSRKFMMPAPASAVSNRPPLN
jgi:ribosomal protein L24